MSDALVLASAFLAAYPVVSSGIWIAGGLLYRLFDPSTGEEPAGGWPGVTVLTPAYNEERVIGRCIEAARAIDYPELEVLVLDDGSTDGTVAAATSAAAGDERVEVVPDPVNRGKADRLNLGFERARHGLVVVTDADTHLHPSAIRLLVARLSRSRRIAAVAGAPHVTNRWNLLCAMQTIETASIIGLIRRTQALSGKVGVVAGVLGLFRKDAVLAVGGYRAEMATEDIDLTWRLLLAGWHTSYEPAALVGMEVPSTVRALWAQRSRWARGQGEVMRVHLRELLHWRQRRLWPLALEGLASLTWVLLLALLYAALALIAVFADVDAPTADVVTFLFSWGIAICAVAAVQVVFALSIDRRQDPLAARASVLTPVYPIAYWMITASAAARAELPALLRGPAGRRVVWDIPRE